MTHRRLPIGIQTFRKIHEGSFYDVDKPAFAGRLSEEGTHSFLSPPRGSSGKACFSTPDRAVRG